MTAADHGVQELDVNDNPHFAFYDYRIMYASLKDTAWKVEAEDSFGEDCSIAVDNKGNVHISYCDDMNEDLKHDN